jgi:hypothetical protein
MADKKIPEGIDFDAFTTEDSPMSALEVMNDPKSRDLGTAKLGQGDPAYDFSSPVYDFGDGAEAATGKKFNLLASVREKPVALIFGSYT